GGSSTPILTDAHLDVPLDYESVAQAGSMLGTRALQVFDHTTSVVRVATRWLEFYKHESCGKCTPCREGTSWLVRVLKRLEAGKGQPGDLELLDELAGNIFGKAFCALGDGAVSPVTSGLKYFREEFEAGMHTPADEVFPPERSTLFAYTPRGPRGADLAGDH
ncbi:MAG: NADH-quinone oxidoreductase subunit F, partial [Micrococcales bacterium]|nr:NADH-quinone oxidoreductase subunit F [Micrococcales bacterium]